ncbi:hypothetical protein ACN28S_27605 [Cystobacter fuscus]
MALRGRRAAEALVLPGNALLAALLQAAPELGSAAVAPTLTQSAAAISVGTRKMRLRAMVASTSSGSEYACSTESTPAWTARRTLSSFVACAATGRLRRCASSVMAFSSSRVSRLGPLSTMTLMQSAPS